MIDSKQNVILESFNQTKKSYPLDQCIHEIFATQAQQFPHAEAVRFQDQSLTYGQLNEQTNQLAHLLIEQGIGSDRLVAVCMERSLELEVALLAILKAGGAYVPVDPLYPQQRIDTLIRQGDIGVVLTQTRFQNHFSADVTVLCLDGNQDQWTGYPVTNPPPVCQLGDLAYVIYTSGSTGEPKGVMIEHGAILNRLQWMQETFNLTAEERVLQKTPFNFDVSVWEFFWPMITGATLVFAQPEGHKDTTYLVDLINREHITTVHFVPSMLDVFLEHPQTNQCQGLRRIICSGEALPYTLQKHCQQRLPQAELHNLYGPTEAAVDVSWWDCQTPQAQGLVPIGRPIANTQLYILDRTMQSVPIGTPGELYIGGVQLARGYLNRPDLTAERFVPNPFDKGHSRLYRTGDLTRYLPDGNIEFLGRLDFQVKIRGFRIELGEIEAALLRLPEIRQAVVLVREDLPGHKILVAYYTTQGQEITDTTLQQELAQSLPDYLIPNAWVELNTLPLTPNGKINRKALPAPQHRPSENNYQPPQTPTQETLVTLFQEILPGKTIGIHDNFFQGGGNSILATRLTYAMHRAFDAEISIAEIFRTPTVAGLAETVDRQTGTTGPSITPMSRLDPLPLSSNQLQLWFLGELTHASTLYHLPTTLQLQGPLNIDALRRAYQQMIQRHEALRTTFTQHDGQITQIIHTDIKNTLAIEEVTDINTLAKRTTEEALRPFDLEQGPLIRAHLFCCGPEQHTLLLVLHHIITDGWSQAILFQEVAQLYNAYINETPIILPPLRLQYADYAAFQQQWFKGDAYRDQITYWKKQLAGAPQCIDLYTDYPRPALQRFEGQHLHRVLDAELNQTLQDLAQAQGKTFFMLLLTAFKILLFRYTGQEDLVVGTPAANRLHSDMEPVIGFFVNTLALRTQLQENLTVQELFDQVEQVCQQAYAHQEVPLERLVDELDMLRDASRSPLVQVMFVLQNAVNRSVPLAQLEVQCDEMSTHTAKFDLMLVIEEVDNQLTLTAEFCTHLFRPDTVACFLETYHRLLQSITKGLDQSIAALPLLTATEQQHIIETHNQTDVPYPQAGSVAALFEQQTERSPHNIALINGDQEWSYDQLNQRANQLARYLRDQGVAPGETVGVCLERSPQLITALLGILKAGAAYVPLDAAYPDQRLTLMIKDANLALILTQTSRVEQLPTVSVPLLLLDCNQTAIAQYATGNGDTPTDPEALAYVMYTSGSTGTPKGVAIAQRGILRLLCGVDYVDLNSPQILLQCAPVGFDASTFEIWAALLHGHRLVLYPGDTLELDVLRQVIATHKVTCLWLTASLFNLIIDTQPSLLHNVCQVLTGGEALSVDHVRRAQEQLPQTQFINGYGPTESTTFACCYPIPDIKQQNISSIPIGQPIGNTQVYLLDPCQHPVPMGCPGELYIGGMGLAHGYVNHADLTAERFIPNPFDQGQTRLYRTGDRARYLPDGNIEFLGRLDFQVKIRGFRLELGEIEATLARIPEIQQAVVLARKDLSGSHTLVGYYTTKDHEITDTHLHQALAESLPDYMIPTAWVKLDALPLTPNGKIDRQTLPVPPQPNPANDYQPPQTPTQETLVTLFQEILPGKTIGIHDNFFQVGGNSILAMRLTYAMHQAFDTEVSIAEVFRTPTVASLAQTVDQSTGTVTETITPVSRQKFLPLSSSQLQLWLLNELVRPSALYNVPMALHLQGVLNIDALQTTYQELIKRHEALRTLFAQHEDQTVQIIQQEINETLSLEEVNDSKTLDRRLREEAQCPFDLEHGPLIRARLFQYGTNQHTLLLVLHHIITDGWSQNLLFQELMQLYNAQVTDTSITLPSLALQYADYAAWQQQWLKSDTYHQQMSYWKEQLANAPQSIDLLADYPRPAIQSFQGKHLQQVLESELTQQLEDLAQQQGKTLFMLLLTAFKILLYRYTGQEDLVVGTPAANRRHRDMQSVMGFFVNTLALRTQLRGSQTLQELFDHVQKTCQQAYTHQEVPLERLVDELGIQRKTNQMPLIQLFFSLEDRRRQSLSLTNLKTKIETLTTDTAKCDLTLTLIHDQTLTADIEYDQALFRSETIQSMLGHYQRVLESFTHSLDKSLSELPLLTPHEREKIQLDFNQTERNFPREKTVHQLFEEQVHKTPSAIALLFDKEQFTYQQLNEQANQVAHYLLAQGIGPETLVGVYLNRSPQIIVTLLGILKAGAAYVPMDPLFPEERLLFMVEDAQVTLVLGHGPFLQQLPEDVHGIDVLHFSSAIASSSRNNPNISACPHPLAYTIYTSGSTGRPKGVQVEHRALINFVYAMHQLLGIDRNDSFLSVTTMSFDIFGLECFGPLTAGASLVLANQEDIVDGHRLAHLLKQHNITLMQATPITWYLLLAAGWQGKTNLKILCGGEALPLSLANDLQTRCAELWNLYGPTETTIWSTVFKVDETPTQETPPDSTVSVGRPIANTQVYLFDTHQQLVPIGVPGELYIGGEGLARGYLSRPELTAGCFVPNPLDQGQSRLYRTGDLARYRPDGNLEFLGRLDFQVKIRGFRIELGEIEAALLRIPEIQQAVVLVREDVPGHKTLVAYYTTEGQSLPKEQLRLTLSDALPEYMIPTAWVQLASLPRTPNGKINRKVLPAPEYGGTESNDQAPQTPLQETLVQLFQEILAIQTLGIHDNFFQHGGNSLLGIKLFHQIEKQLHQRLPLATLFRAQTVQQLAALLECQHPTTSSSLIVPIVPGGSSTPLFILPGAGGHTLAFSKLGQQLKLDQPVYGLELRGLDGKADPHDTIEDMAVYFMSLIATVQSKGPYYLLGYSLGARIAFEMALRYQRQGETVALLGSIASTAPGYPRNSRNRMVRIGLRLMDFWNLDLQQKWQYLQFKLRLTTRRLIQRLQRLGQPRHDEETIALKHIRKVEEGALAALSCYAPSDTFLGDMLLIRDMEIDSPLYRSLIHSNAGWERYIRGNIHKCELASGHTEILKSPFVEQMAAQIRDFVNQSGPYLRPEPSPSVATLHSEWKPLPSKWTSTAAGIKVVQTDLSQFTAQLVTMTHWLSPEEQKRAEAFKRPKDRTHYVLRHGILRQLLGTQLDLSPADILFTYDDTGKPSIDKKQNPHQLHFSMSSRQGIALYAFAHKKNIGVDFEPYEPFADFMTLARQQFSPREYESLSALPTTDQGQAFFHLWTCKEAYLKARGIIPLPTFSIQLNEHKSPQLWEDQYDPLQVGQWTFVLLTWDNHWQGALVYQGPLSSVSQWTMAATPDTISN